jgi:hypothetical protein
MKTKERETKPAENEAIFKEKLKFYTWALLSPDDAGAQRYGHKDLRDACHFWIKNHDAIFETYNTGKPYALMPHNFENADCSINNLMIENGWQ